MSAGFRKLLVSVFLMVTLVTGGVMVARWLYATRPEAQRSGVDLLAPLVRVSRLSVRNIPLVFEGFGTARADLQAKLTAEVTGPVIALADGVKEGSLVRKDQPLVHIDDRDYQYQLARTESLIADVEARIGQLDVERVNAENLLALAEQDVSVNRDELNRLLNLFEQDKASKREVDLARLDFQRSRRDAQDFRNQIELIEPRRVSLVATRRGHEADAHRARLNIEKCVIKAPFDGTVERLSVNVGDRVMPGGEILGLVSTELMEVPVELPAAVRPNVGLGATSRLEVENIPNITWEGQIERLSPGSDPSSRTFTAYVMVDNSEQDTPLLPGYFVTARVSGPVLEKVLAVPRNALIDGRLFVANDQQVHSRPVRVVRYVGDQAVISGDVSPGDLVIVTNLDKLTDGLAIRIDASGVPGVAGAESGDPPDFAKSRGEP